MLIPCAILLLNYQFILEDSLVIIKEFCAENFTNIPSAIASGANRIELCDNLTVGGTTVSKGVMTETLAYCAEKKCTCLPNYSPSWWKFRIHRY